MELIKDLLTILLFLHVFEISYSEYNVPKVKKGNPDSTDNTSNPETLDDMTLKDLFYMLNKGKKSFGLKTDNPSYLVKALNKNPQNTENLLHKTIQDSSNLGPEPDLMKSLALSQDSKGFHVDNMTNKYINPPRMSLPKTNEDEASNVFKMVIEKNLPKKTGKNEIVQKITIIESERSKPLSTNELLNYNFTRTQVRKTRHRRHHKKRHSRRLKQQVEDDSHWKTTESNGVKELLRVYFFDSDTNWKNGHESHNDSFHLKHDDGEAKDDGSSLWNPKYPLICGFIILVSVCFLLLSVALLCVMSGSCGKKLFVNSPLPQKHRVRTIKMHTDNLQVKSKGLSQCVVRDNPIICMSFEKRRPQGLQELEWQTESGDWMA